MATWPSWTIACACRARASASSSRPMRRSCCMRIPQARRDSERAPKRPTSSGADGPSPSSGTRSSRAWHLTAPSRRLTAQSRARGDRASVPAKLRLKPTSQEHREVPLTSFRCRCARSSLCVEIALVVEEQNHPRMARMARSLKPHGPTLGPQICGFERLGPLTRGFAASPVRWRQW
jgi:hypothetical protein